MAEIKSVEAVSNELLMKIIKATIYSAIVNDERWVSKNDKLQPETKKIMEMVNAALRQILGVEK
jgi:hypothetical protein